MTTFKITVRNINEWDLSTDQVEKLQSTLGVESFEELIALDPGGDAEFSGEEVSVKYRNLDRQILPNLWLEIFTDNFKQSDLLFSESPSFFQKGLQEPSGNFQGSRLILIEMSGDSTNFHLEMQLESDFFVKVNEGIDFRYDGDNSEEVNDQIYECNNMANFGFNDLDLENEDGCNHNWSAEKV